MKLLRYGILLLAATFSGCASINKHDDTHHNIPVQVVSWSQTNAMHVAVNNGSGSGFWADNDTFITACHVVGTEYMYYGDPDGDGESQSYGVFEVEPEAQVSNSDLSVTLNLAVESCDQQTDIAVLKRQWLESDSEFTALPTYLAHPNPEFGEVVYGAGYGLSERLHITVGHWQSTPRYEEDRPRSRFIVTMPTIFGDSGSPALRLHNGRVEVVGIRQAIRNSGQGGVTHLTIVSDAMDIHIQIEKSKQ